MLQAWRARDYDRLCQTPYLGRLLQLRQFHVYKDLPANPNNLTTYYINLDTK